ncbi:MAG: hypothetical protein EAZ89_08860 [Bacteroidetes bacterium]|nr:MAG: hypothetical protein EAZ89_08860 [Bacteroidota bacterium]
MRSALILALFALFLLFSNCLEAQKPTYRVYLLNGSYHDKVALETGKIQDSTSSSIQVFTADTSFYLLKKDIYAIARLDSADQMALLYKNTGADIPYPVLHTAIEPHLSLLRFSPAKHKGDLIEFWVNIPFNFRLTE